MPDPARAFYRLGPQQRAGRQHFVIKFRAAALAVAAGLALSACSGIHLGEAVVVDDTTISMDELDDVSESFCVFVIASSQQQGAPAQDVAGGDAREKAAQTLIQLTAAKEVADDLGVSVPPSEYALESEQLASLKERFGGAKTKELREVVEMLQRTALLYNAIGAEKLGIAPDAGNAQEVAAAGEKAVQQAIKDAHIAIDPRINLSEKAVATDVTSGSLSVGVSQLANAEVSDYAVSQRCS